MKVIRLKLWQAILLAFSAISVATGGVVLYTYFTTGFESSVVKPESIYFQKDENYNTDTNQFEIDSSFSLTIKAANSDVTEKDIVLSFEKSLSTDSDITYSESVKDGIKYISNGILTVPQNVKIGEAFDVTVNQSRFSIEGEGYTYYANVGGLSTLLAKTTDKLDKKETRANIAVDVSVDSVRFNVKDTDEVFNKNYEVDEGKCIILQSSTFEIDVKYYPASSRYRYSDNLFEEFYSTTKEVVRQKDFCFDSADINVLKHYNNGNVYFTSNNVISENNNVDIYLFKKAKGEDEFEKQTTGLEGEIYYNAMLSYLVETSNSLKIKETISFDIQQASVGSVVLTNKEFDGLTNKLFKLCVNNNSYGNGSLGLGIANTEGENLASAMISQLGVLVSYTKPGEARKTLSVGDDTVVIKGATGNVVLGTDVVTSPYYFGGNQTEDTSVVVGKTYWTKTNGILEVVETPVGNPSASGYYENVKTYFLINASMKNLNNAYWEISTTEDSLEIEIQIVLFVLDEEGKVQIFDEANNSSRVATLSIESHEDAGIAWQGETSLNRTIIHSSEGSTVSAHVDSASKISVPRDNVYQTVRYFVAKSSGDVLSTNDVNLVGNFVKVVTNDENNFNKYYIKDGNVYKRAKDTEEFKIYNFQQVYYVFEGTEKVIEGITYYLATSGDLFFKKAGTYYVRFVTVRTDAYGKIIYSGGDFVVEKNSSILSVDVAETLQPFESTKIQIENSTTNGVFRKTEDEVFNSGKDYYTLNDYEYQVENTVSASNFEAMKDDLYELSYYALHTGSTGVKLIIEVGETDISMLETEIETNHRLVVNAISADGTITIPMQITSISQGSSAKQAILSLTISDEATIPDLDGKGQAFYLQIDYNNTVAHIYTDVQVTDHPKTANALQCFMIYTQTPNEIINENLKEQSFDAEIELDENAEYTQCSITYEGPEGPVGLGTEYTPEKRDKDALNTRIGETIILDGYGRKMAKTPIVSIVGNASSIYISDNKVEFASGTENSIALKVSAGNNSQQEEVCYNFVLNTESFGLSKVKAGGVDFVGERLSNIVVNVQGKKNDAYTLKDVIKVYVGQSVTELATNKYFIYVKVGNDSNLLDMLSFDNDAAKTSSTTPITSLTIGRDFYAEGSLRLYVSNKDYSVVPNTAVETVSFEVSIVFSSYVTATIYNTEEMIASMSSEPNLIPGVYAGHYYQLNDLISLKNKSNPAGTISWANSTYNEHVGEYQIARTGVISTNASDPIGTVGECLYFFDVAEITSYTISFFYYESNPYCYQGSITFEVYPNLTLAKSTGSTSKEKICLVDLAKRNDPIENYFETVRIRGTEAITGTSYRRLGGESYTVETFVDGGSYYFTFDPQHVLELGYGQFSDVMTLGLYLGDDPVKDANGDDIVYPLAVEVGTKLSELKTVLKERENYVLTQDVSRQSGKTYYKLEGGDYVVYAGADLTGCYEFVDKYLDIVVYDSNEVLFVDEGSRKYQKTDPNQTIGIEYETSLTDKKYYLNIMNYKHSYSNEIDNGLRFDSHGNGVSVGNEEYLYLQVKVMRNDVLVTVAQIKVPILISGVGLDYVKYSGGFSTDLHTLLYGGGDYKITTDAEPVDGKQYFTYDGEFTEFVGSEFVGGTTYYEFVEDENYPYEVMIAGRDYQISFDTDSLGANYGLYREKEKVQITSITFDSKDANLGVLTKDAGGDWHVAFANYAGEDRMVVLNVSYERGNSTLNFTYRILLKANVDVKTIYPFGTDSTAEFVSVTGEQVYDLAGEFGVYAGNNSDKTRYNFYIDETGFTKLDETKDYYVQTEPGTNVLAVGTKLYTMSVAVNSSADFDIYYILDGSGYVKANDGVREYDANETYYIFEVAYTLTEAVRIEDYDDNGSYYKIKLFTTTYYINKISYKPNSTDGSDMYFDEFEDGNYISPIVANNDRYYLSVSTDASETKTFMLTLNNTTVVANFKLTIDGVLTFVNMNENYAVGLSICKNYSSVVGGKPLYNFEVNNLSGYYYIDYAGIAENKSQDVETDFGNSFTFNVHFTDNEKLRDTTLELAPGELTKSEHLFDMRGQEVNIATKVEVNLEKVLDTTDYILTLQKLGTFDTFVDQDYVLVIYFSAFENQLSTSLTINIPCTVKETATNVELNAGTTLDVETLNTKLAFKSGATPVSITSFALVEPYRDIVNTSKQITALKEDIEDVTLKFEFTCDSGKFYRDITVTLKANVTPVQSVSYGDTYYAGEEGSVTLRGSFYSLATGSLLQGGSLAIDIVNEPTHFKKDVASSYVKIEAGELKFKSENVSSRVVGEIIRVKFTYTFGEDSFEWTTAFSVTIEPNTYWTVTYPDPATKVVYTKATGEYDDSEEYYRYQSGAYELVTEKDENDFNENKYYVKNEKSANALSGESVFAETEYENFFAGMAAFAGQKRTRAFDNETNELSLESATIKIKTMTNAGVSVKVGESEFADYDLSNYQSFERTGVSDVFKFCLANNSSNGTVVFEIELNGVVTEYTVYVFEKYVRANVVQVAQTADGALQTIYIENVTEGVLFAENMLAKVMMPASVPSGTYYIKINGTTNNWVRFYYDAESDEELYVLIGETIEEQQIEKICASKSTASLDMRTTAGVEVKLTSFATLRYKTVRQGVETEIEIGDYVDLTYVDLTAYEKEGKRYIKASDLGDYDSSATYFKYIAGEYTQVATNNEGDFDQYYVCVTLENTALIKLEDGYYTISAAEGLSEKVADIEAQLTLYVDGTYSVYDAMFDINGGESGGETYVSLTNTATEGFLLEDTDGLGQEVKEVGSYYYFEKEKNGVDKTYYVTEEVSGYNYVTQEVSGYNENTHKEADEYKKVTFADNVTLTSDITGPILKSETNYYVIHGDDDKYYYVYKTQPVNTVSTKYTYLRSITVTESDSHYYEDGVEDGEHELIPGAYEDLGYVEFLEITLGGITYYMSDSANMTAGTHKLYLKQENVTTYKPNYDFGLVDSVPTVGDDYYHIHSISYTAASVLTVENATITDNYVKVESKHTGIKDQLIEQVQNPYTLVVRGGKTYAVSGVGAKHYFIATNSSFYRPETKVEHVSGKVVSDDIDIGGGQTLVKLKTGKYVVLSRENINFGILFNSEYVIANTNTFIINSIPELKVGDEVSLTFDYLIENRIVDAFEVKFKMDVDVEVQKAYSNTYANTDVKKLDYFEGGIQKVANYIEIEVNNTYDFNQLTKVVRATSGEVLSAGDFGSNCSASLEVVSVSDAENIIGSELKAKLAGSGGLKDNSDIIRFAFELVKTSNSPASPVYNFNIRARGADNDGDFVLVKYTYTINIANFSFSNEKSQYTFVRYILFKLISDYQVTMKDTAGNSLIAELNGAGQLTNENNVGYITDFTKIGAIVENVDEHSNKLKDIYGRPDSPEEFDLIAGNIFKYTYGEAGKYTETSTNSDLTAITYVATNQIYYVRTQSIGYGTGANDTISKTATYSVNLNIVATSNLDSLITVTSKNAVNSLQNLSAGLFKAELGEINADDISNYLDLSYCTIESDNTVAKNSGGMRIRIKSDLCLGERPFTVTLEDDYGYKIVYYFTLVASSNPVYAKGSLRYTEGDYFDIGAMFEVVSINSWKTQETLYVPDASGTVYFAYKGVNGNYNKLSTNNYMYKVESGGTYEKRDTPTGQAYKEFEEVIYSSVSEGTYFIGDCVGEEPGIEDNFLRIRNGTAQNKYITDIPKSCLAPNSIATSLKDPEINTSGDNFKDTIVLSGINAFGYEEPNVNFNKPGDYFVTGCDLDKIKVTNVYLTYNGNTISTIYSPDSPIDEGKKLASSGGYYKYGESSGAMGRYVNPTAYQIPILPGWVYEDKDSANVTMNILLKYSFGGKEETYNLKIPVTIEKEEQRVLTLDTTNVSDDTKFTLSDHLKTNGGGSFDFYDDTIAVTLPALGKVDVNIVAGLYTEASNAGEYDPSGIYYTRSGDAPNFTYTRVVANDENNYDDYYVLTEYSGTQTLRSSYGVDYTYYVGISRTVGHTLDPTCTVDVTFTNYDNTKVTREGHIGFYASYENSSASGADGDLSSGTSLVYYNGYGKISADVNENRGRFTAVYMQVTSNVEADKDKYYYLNDGTYQKITFGESVKYYTRSDEEPYVYTAVENPNQSDFDEGKYYIQKKDHSGYIQAKHVYQIAYIPTECIKESNGTLLRETQYILAEHYTVEETDNKVISWNNWGANITEDTLHLTDVYNLTGGKQSVTKYYIGVFEDDSKAYQIVKNYNLYPKYFDFGTTDYNDSATATAERGLNETTFDFDSWATEVLFKHYNNQNSSTSKNGSEIDNLNSIYFELGEGYTALATIDASTGAITVDNASYTLNGQEFIQIRIYVKASGETGQYIDDNLEFSGNNYNNAAITVSVYLRAATP